ncbi:MAG: serine protease [Chloroflexi bacterium]|nr:MAG: serine protease [Chloroflexota bacterium]RLT33871.1 MAG: serine protease [Chloroflexota bacterium]
MQLIRFVTLLGFLLGVTACTESSQPPTSLSGLVQPTPEMQNEAPTRPSSAEQTQPVTVQDVIGATVRIGVLDAGWQEVGHGSGSIIDSRGLILTNFHVIGNNETGQYHNRDGVSYIYVTLNPRDPPKLQFISQVVDADPGKDIAVLRIIATTNGEPPADCLDLPQVTLDTKSQVEIGNKLTSVGYSGVGGDTISIASGQVVGFENFSMSNLNTRSYEAIKYDASDSRGSSGGPIVNELNQQVAIVFAGNSDQGDSLGYARSIQLADDLIQSAQLVRIPGCNGAAAAVLIGPTVAEPTVEPTTTTTATDAQEYVIEGRVLDSVTGDGVDGVVVAILKPGYTWDSVNYDDLASYVWIYAETNRDGVYTLTVTDEMVNTPVAFTVAADGYQDIKSNSATLIEYYDQETNMWIDIFMDADS